jgi:hypothetical protein
MWRWISQEFESKVLAALQRIIQNQETELATIADLDAALAAEDTELTSLSAAVAANSAILQKLADSASVPPSLTAEVAKVLADNATLATAINTVTSTDANPTGAPTLTVSPATLSITGVGSVGTASISDSTTYSAGYTATSSDTTVATVAVSGAAVTVTEVAPGSSTITISTSETPPRTATISVTAT